MNTRKLPQIMVEDDIWDKCAARLKPDEGESVIPDLITADERLMYLAGKAYNQFYWRNTLVAVSRYEPTEEELAEAQAWFEERAKANGGATDATEG